MSAWARLRWVLIVAAVLAVAWVIVLRIVRVPSGAMMPTLLSGDRVLVYQLAYALRVPFIGTKLQDLGAPQRGEVVVFHRQDPSALIVKRVAGLPGDHVQLRGSQLLINGTPVPVSTTGTYNDGCYIDLQRGKEKVGAHQHEVLFCPVPLQVTPAPPTCIVRGVPGYLCRKDAEPDPTSQSTDEVVPAGSYFLVGDNRTNSDDGRTYDLVPADNLVGRALVIWSSGDTQRRRGLIWERTGKIIE